MNKLQASFLTGFKFLAWTGISAGLITISGELNHTTIPLFAIPLLASLLKSLATWFTVEASKTE